MANPHGNPQNLIPFRPGQSGNPSGKPLLARNRLSARFLGELANDFDQHGRVAIAACREQSPARYLAIIASLLPKELKLERDPALSEYSDEELRAMLDLVLNQVKCLERAVPDKFCNPADEAL
jgi:hypothetical protein